MCASYLQHHVRRPVESAGRSPHVRGIDLSLVWSPVFALIVMLLTGVAVIVWLLREPLFTELRRRRVRRQPFPAAWREILRERCAPGVAVTPAGEVIVTFRLLMYG